MNKHLGSHWIELYEPLLYSSESCLGGKVVGWEVGWGNERPFAVDMAGFAINLQYFLMRTGMQLSIYIK